MNPTVAEIDARLREACPRTCSLVGESTWCAAVEEAVSQGDEHLFPELLARRADRPFVPDLARLELLRYETSQTPSPDRESSDTTVVNPTLQVVPFPWKGLAQVVAGETVEPEFREEILLSWKLPEDDRVRIRAATENDLLALKLVVEELDPLAVAAAEGISLALLDGVLREAASDGLLLAPPSRLRRDPDAFPPQEGVAARYSEATAFTLQWHVTHACDLHCRHCYDRSRRSDLTLEQGIRVLDDLYRFCRDRHVDGQVTFTGGNPLLLPDFDELYRAAVDRGFLVSILGNPAPRERIERLVSIEPPDIYQVSLEGLREHNDYIRGEGHFDRVMAFLPVLRELGVHSMVMLTLTRNNQDQVLPLAERLRDVADTFHFNRLSPVGEGVDLPIPDPESYRSFLEGYLEATLQNPILGLKDNLFNLLRRERGLEVFGGCTGHGCGAAFNFLSVLPDGEAHACRKFPSLVGNVLEQGIAGVYDSEAARRYRYGTEGCRGCALHAVCGGCMASIRGMGRDPFTERDPYCFL